MYVCVFVCVCVCGGLESMCLCVCLCRHLSVRSKHQTGHASIYKLDIDLYRLVEVHSSPRLWLLQ